MKSKIVFLILIFVLISNSIYSKEKVKVKDSTQIQMDEIENSFNYQKGIIEFKSCYVKLTVPDGFRYLDSIQSKFVLSDLWGNPADSSVLGLLVPENKKILDPECWVFVLLYENIGYVKDDDASDINYDELMNQIQKDVQESNIERKKLGYESVEILGWASVPFYDKDKKVLHWAKAIKFGSDSVNTLNYDLRILGKNGVFVLNAVALTKQIDEIKPNIDKVLASVEFEQGSTYFNFNPDVDKVATWTIGGLIAGKVLAKVGLFAIIAKFAKIIIVGIIAAGAAIWRFLTGKKKKEAAQRKELGIGE